MNTYYKELKNITYDIKALQDLYKDVEHLAINYFEKHLESDSPYAKCACKKCAGKVGDHKHRFIRRLERFDNPEVNRLTDLLSEYTKLDIPNKPVIWIYEEGFVLPLHKDYARDSSIIIPILGDSHIDFFDDEDAVIEHHEYSKVHPTIVNAREHNHGVTNTSTRVFLNYNCYQPWSDIINI
jgi:hypothetical protein